MIMAKVGDVEFRKSSTVRALAPLHITARRCLLRFLTEKNNTALQFAHIWAKI